MRILLIAMPETADCIDFVTRLPNLALINIAGSLHGHEVKVLDFVAVKPAIRKPLEEIVASFKPDLVGLSAMTFQFETLVRVAAFCRERLPAAMIVAGGYHATLLAREIIDEQPDLPLDFMVRGEGEHTMRELVDALENEKAGFDNILGLSYRCPTGWLHNEARPLADLASLPLPDRTVRIAGGFHWLELPMDVAETSRGCPYNCKFCSINKMYGNSFRPFPVERIISDLKVIRAAGTRAVFFADDNITYDTGHFMQVCEAIIGCGLTDMAFMVQATAAGLANNPDLVRIMDRANFRFVFVGFESMLPVDLKSVRKPTNPAINQQAAELLRKHGIAIIAGCIVGYPDDDRQSIRRNYRLIRQLIPDMIYAQYMTPYPKTLVREELLAAGLVENIDGYSSYDGFTCNIRTRNLSRDELYRCLKKEALLGYTDLKMVYHNYFGRHHGRYFLWALIKVICVNIINVCTLRQRKNKFDI